MGIRNSVSQCKLQYRIYTGSKVINTIESWGTLFTREEFVSNFGRAFNAAKDNILVMNGDGIANNITVLGATHYGDNGRLVVALSSRGNGAFRINYTVILVD